jgi:VIT1/CCC1 family predicted Fe2+/Mn2+ transporter
MMQPRAKKKARTMLKGLGDKRLIDSIIELIDLVALYIRQNAKKIIEEGVAKPLQAAGRAAGLFLFAFTVFSIASIFLAVGVFLALASLIGYPAAYILIGIVLLIIGGFALRAVGAGKAKTGKKATGKKDRL